MAGIPNKFPSGHSSLDITALTPSPLSQLINNYLVGHNRCDTFILDKLKNDGSKPEFWHRFTVMTDPKCRKKFSKISILKSITEFVYPYPLLPVYSLEKDGKLYFLARNCTEAIIKLCMAKLIVPNLVDYQFPFSVVIIKDITTTRIVPLVSLEKNLLDVFLKRSKKGSLDLDNFCEDEGLEQFYPLFQPRVLSYVLSVIPTFELMVKKKVYKLILSNNNIRTLPDSFRDLYVRCLKLSHNKIENIEDIKALQGLRHLQFLILDGNPLNCRFDDEMTYFLYVKAICPELLSLDGRKRCKGGFYTGFRNFLCTSDGFDFANQFCHQFFTYFDELKRPNIISFYHKNAQFSLTHNFIPDPEGKTLATHYPKLTHDHLNKFVYLNRNVFISKTMLGSLLFNGHMQIGRILQDNIPKTCHDTPFYVDLMQYTKSQAVISVTGMFYDQPVNPVQEKIMFRFQRIFLLKTESKRNPKEWLILNDMWTVYSHYISTKKNPTPLPTRTLISLSSFPEFDPVVNSNAEMEALVLTFSSITELEYGFSKKFLEKNNWDLKLSLEVFMDEHINDEIPNEVLLTNDEINQDEECDDDDVIISDDVALPSIFTLMPLRYVREESTECPESSKSLNNLRPGTNVKAPVLVNTIRPVQIEKTSASTVRQNSTHVEEPALVNYVAVNTSTSVASQNRTNAEGPVLADNNLVVNPIASSVPQNSTLQNVNMPPIKPRRKTRRGKKKPRIRH